MSEQDLVGPVQNSKLVSASCLLKLITQIEVSLEVDLPYSNVSRTRFLTECGSLLLASLDATKNTRDLLARLERAGIDVTHVDMHARALTLEDVADHQVVLIYTTSWIGEGEFDPNDTGDVLFDFVQGGGHVIQMFCHTRLGGRWNVMNYAPVVWAGNTVVTAVMEVEMGPNNFVRGNVSDLINYPMNCNSGPLCSTGELLMKWVDGPVIAAAHQPQPNSGKVVFLNLLPSSCVGPGETKPRPRNLSIQSRSTSDFLSTFLSVSEAAYDQTGSWTGPTRKRTRTPQEKLTRAIDEMANMNGTDLPRLLKAAIRFCSRGSNGSEQLCHDSTLTKSTLPSANPKEVNANEDKFDVQLINQLVSSILEKQGLSTAAVSALTRHCAAQIGFAFQSQPEPLHRFLSSERRARIELLVRQTVEAARG
eukprot:920210_1